MNITPDIIRHEFIGTEVEVAESRYLGYVGISGKVIDETRNSFVILYEGERKRIIKDSTLFRFNLFDGTVVEIDGKLLIGRPRDRLKKRIRRLW